MSWLPVGNPGNAADPATGYGAVSYSYNIGTYDVTNSQYVAFLNSNDPTGADPLSLYVSAMGTAYPSGFGGIKFNSGAGSGSKYSVISGNGNHPVNFVTWSDAARFANWMDNGQPAFTTEPTSTSNATEHGAYTLLGYSFLPTNLDSVTRTPGATIFLPSENEWYKAAYYNPATSLYFLYPTSSNTAPAESIPTAAANSVNINSVVDELTDVGAYTGTTSPYGAFDMAGNVDEWNDSQVGGGENRGLRGGSFLSNWGPTVSTNDTYPNYLNADSYEGEIGFRLASVPGVPEPSSAVLAALAGMGLIGLVSRRRRSAVRIAKELMPA